MSVEPIFRIAACCLLVAFGTTVLPARAAADETDMQTYYDTEIQPEGMLCTDDMIEEPYRDELEPTLAAYADGGCSVPDLPIST